MRFKQEPDSFFLLRRYFRAFYPAGEGKESKTLSQI